MKTNFLVMLGFVISIGFLTMDSRAQVPEEDQKKALALLIKLDLISETESGKPGKVKAALRAFQEKEDIAVTETLDGETVIELYLASMLFDLKNEGKVVPVQISRQGLREIHKMPIGTVFYMSKTNPIKTLCEVKQGEFGVWKADLHYHMCVNVQFCQPSPWDHGRAIGNAYWGELFHRYPKLKIFVSRAQYHPDEKITGTGGGLRIEFVVIEPNGAN